MKISAFDISEKYNSVVNENTIYSYLGYLSQSELDMVLDQSEEALSKSLSSKLAIKKIYNILIEGAQNIFIYLKDKTYEDHLLNSFIAVNSQKDKYSIIIGNFMLRQDIISIQRRIELVNVLSDSELKDLYRGVLSTGGTSERGGAGLGFIDIAKRSSGQLVYDFADVDDNYAFFTLETVVEIGDDNNKLQS